MSSFEKLSWSPLYHSKQTEKQPVAVVITIFKKCDSCWYF